MPELVKLLKDHDETNRARAVVLLAGIGSTAVLPLKDILADGDVEVRVWTAEALGRIGPEAGAALSELLTSTKDSAAGVRCASVSALGKIAPAQRCGH